jgi:hypothetical protein
MANLGEIRANCKFDLSVNDSQLDDHISDASWNRLINQSYNKAWKELRTQVAREATVQSYDFAWTTGALTMDLPDAIKDGTLHQIVEVNSSGVPIREFQGFFETRNRLRVMGGLAYSATLRVYYIPEVEQLVLDEQVPLLIPPQHHDFIEWETLLLVKQLQDKEIPEAWQKRYNELKFSLFNEFKSRPFNPRPGIRLPGAPMLRPLL